MFYFLIEQILTKRDEQLDENKIDQQHFFFLAFSLEADSFTLLADFY